MCGIDDYALSVIRDASSWVHGDEVIRHDPEFHMTKQMILIHGAWLCARSWENYLKYFSAVGYDVSAPEWPRKHGDVEALREDTTELAGLGVAEIVDHYDALIRVLPEPPVLIGHSFGGLFVQLLLDRGLGRAGVAIDPASPTGVLRVAPSSLKAAGPAIKHPSSRHGVVELAAEEFNYGFTNTFDPAAATVLGHRFWSGRGRVGRRRPPGRRPSAPRNGA